MEPRGNEEEAGVQTAIATVWPSGTLNEKLEAIAKAQFRGVEMFENDLLSFNGTPAVKRCPLRSWRGSSAAPTGCRCSSRK